MKEKSQTRLSRGGGVGRQGGGMGGGGRGGKRGRGGRKGEGNLWQQFYSIPYIERYRITFPRRRAKFWHVFFPYCNSNVCILAYIYIFLKKTFNPNHPGPFVGQCHEIFGHCFFLLHNSNLSESLFHVIKYFWKQFFFGKDSFLVHQSAQCHWHRVEITNSNMFFLYSIKFRYSFFMTQLIWSLDSWAKIYFNSP